MEFTFDRAGINLSGSPADLRHVLNTMPLASLLLPVDLATLVKRDGSNGLEEYLEVEAVVKDLLDEIVGSLFIS